MKFTICDYFQAEGKRCSRCFKLAPVRTLLYPPESKLGILGSYCDECMKFIQEKYSNDGRAV